MSSHVGHVAHSSSSGWADLDFPRLVALGARQLDRQNAVLRGRLHLLRVDVERQRDRARERAERPLTPVEAGFWLPRLRLAATFDRERVLMHGQIDGIETDAWNLGGDDDPLWATPDVNRRKFGRGRPLLVAEGPVDLLLNALERRQRFTP